MLVNPFRDTWVVAEDFEFRGVTQVAGSVFRIRNLHPRVWKRLIQNGSLVRKADYDVKVAKVVVAEEPVETEKAKPATKPKKSTKSTGKSKKKPAAKKES